ncbi:MAG: cysteine--tRNA ligase [Dehalococcoidia bacterium]
MPLKLYSTLGHEVREFRTVVPGEVRMYVCGVTPYFVTHLGHAFSYVQFDTLRRYLEASGYRVKYVQNVTDIDDDMIRVSKQTGRPIAEVRDENIASLRYDLDRLNVLRPTAYPFATEYIAEMQAATAALVASGQAYARGTNVFFRARSFPHYGDLKALGPAQLGKLENPEVVDAEKRDDPLDFHLWQPIREGDAGAEMVAGQAPGWESPWGVGRPGWHIECTAMSMATLGEQIDIHGGGSDLIYPHHTNEIAQAESVTGKSPFTGYWVHNGMLMKQGEKMAKSKPETLAFARDVMAVLPPDQLRMYLLGMQIRANGDYQVGAVEALAERFGRFQAVAAQGPGEEVARTHPVLRAFHEAMDDDFNAPQALEGLDAAAARVAAGVAETGSAAAVRQALGILGFAFAGARGPANGDFAP